MMKVSSLVVSSLVLISAPAIAKKPDWPTERGTGIIGFGIVEVSPGADGKPSDVEFDYDIPAKYVTQLASGQIMVVPAGALKEYNDIPETAVVAKAVGKAPSEGNFHMSVTLHVTKPGAYVVAYGPFDGLLIFDDVNDSRETYKISAKSTSGASIHWVDQDAGDFTVSRFHKNSTETTAILRLRMVRDRDNMLKSHMMMTGQSLQLNEQALQRVKMIDANW